MKRTVQLCLFVAMFVVFSSSYAAAQQTTAAQQTQQGEEAQKEEVQKFVLRQGQGEASPKIITWVAGSSCFKGSNPILKVGDKSGSIGLKASLGWLASRNAEVKVEIRGNLQYYLCTVEESALPLEKIDPTRFRYQDAATIISRSRVDWDPRIRVESNGIEETLWIMVAKGRRVMLKSLNTTYGAMKPTEFVPMWNSVEEMPKTYQSDGWISDGKRNSVRTRNPGWKEKWPHSTPPPIWKSVKYEWARWTPARNPEDALVLRTLSGNGFSIAGVIFSWDSPVLNPAPSAGSVELKPKPLTLSYKAKYTSMAFCLLKQSDISSVDPSLLEFRQVQLDQNYAGSISLETGDVLVFLLDDKNYLAMRPVRVEKSGQFTAVFYERKRGPITPSVASTKKGDLARSAR